MDLFDQYLIDNEKLTDIKNYDEKLMNIHTDKVLDLIEKGPGEWEDLVPKIVAKQIKQNHLFGFPEKAKVD